MKHLGNGTAIIIKESIKYTTIIISETKNEKILEHTIIQLKFKKNKNLYIISAYARCSNP